mmetsp:Transcript_53405/g.141578  ORF Transcript_53405/g.141578 Transcript_53405/m.141578 type:complete len:227 (+) Transcript_53405:231-911(+)
MLQTQTARRTRARISPARLGEGPRRRQRRSRPSPASARKPQCSSDSNAKIGAAREEEGGAERFRRIQPSINYKQNADLRSKASGLPAGDDADDHLCPRFQACATGSRRAQPWTTQANLNSNAGTPGAARRRATERRERQRPTPTTGHRRPPPCPRRLRHDPASVRLVGAQANKDSFRPTDHLQLQQKQEVADTALRCIPVRTYEHALPPQPSPQRPQRKARPRWGP